MGNYQLIVVVMSTLIFSARLSVNVAGAGVARAVVVSGMCLSDSPVIGTRRRSAARRVCI